MRRTLPLLALTVALVLTLSCGDPASARGPNVLLIVMDTTRADRCSFMGYARPTTPRLDALAREGVTFLDAWAPCCWTKPSHASLFTGLLPEHHGVIEHIRQHLAPEATTLAEHFQAAGWSTACFTNNDHIAPENGLTQGFDRVDALYEKTARPYPYALETHRRALEWAVAKHAEEEPFFLFINDMEPHLPYSPPANVAAPFIQGSPEPMALAAARDFNFPWSVGYCLGRTEVPPAKLALLSDLYDAEIATLDAELGKLLDGLKAAGILDHTVVVVCSDHGENLGEHGRLGHLLSLHRNTLRVPLLVRYPGRFDGGRKVEEVVRLIDVAPTLLELAGLAVPPDLDGRTLSRDLAGRIALAVVGAQTREIPDMQRAFPGADMSIFRTSIRSAYDGRFHFIRHSTGREEMYDLRSDPVEAIDLAGAGGPDMDRLRKLAGE